MDNRNSNKILCVDLDGTFLQTDMLYESFVYCFMKNPLILFLCIIWLIRGGKTLLKEKLANKYSFDPSLLPVNTSVHNLIRSKKDQGYLVFLISASADKIVKEIFDDLLQKEKERWNDVDYAIIHATSVLYKLNDNLGKNQKLFEIRRF